MRLRQSAFFSCLCVFLLALTGCALESTASPDSYAGAAITGSIHGGQQPVTGAHIYLLAANTTGYGSASVSLLNAALTLHSDSIGAYVLSGSDGSFNISGDYVCTANTQVYLYVLGGNPGAGANSYSGELAILGNCPGTTFSPTLYVSVNELTTVAAAYAMAGFATDATHVSSSGTTLAQTGIANAFANAANMVPLGTGVALATTPAGNGAVPQAEIRTLGNILASCINTSGSYSGPTSATPCYTLMNNALSGGTTGTVPTDTATAAINIAHNPTANVGNLYLLSTPTSPFPVSGFYQPNDWSVSILYTGGGLSEPLSIAIDATGNAWVANANTAYGTKLSPQGASLFGTTGFYVGYGTGIFGQGGIAIDTSGNAWITTQNLLHKVSASGTTLSGTGYSGGGLATAFGVAIDGLGNVWTANTSADSVSEFTSAGVPVSSSTGYYLSNTQVPYGLAIDSSNNVWTANYYYICSASEFSNSGTVLSGRYGFDTQSSVLDPRAVAIDATGKVWIANEQGNSITVLNTDGSYYSTGFTGGNMNNPSGIAFDGAGTAWVSNRAYNYYGGITHLSSTGTILSGSYGLDGGNINATNGLDQAFGMAVDGSGNVWVTNYGGNSVMQFVGAAVPVVTPLASGVANKTLATRP